MKKYVLVLTVMVISACLLSGCMLPFMIDTTSSSNSELTNSESNSSTSAESSSDIANENKTADNEEGVGEIADGDFTIKIKDAVLTKNYDGQDVVVVKFDFTNNSEETTSFWVEAQTKVFQNGVELESSIPSSQDEANYALIDNRSKEIRPGVTLEVGECYILNDTTSPIEVETEEYLSFTDTGKVTKTIPIA